MMIRTWWGQLQQRFYRLVGWRPRSAIVTPLEPPSETKPKPEPQPEPKPEPDLLPPPVAPPSEIVESLHSLPDLGLEDVSGRQLAHYNGAGRSADVQEAGRWYFKKGILDKLNAYFEVLGTMRRTDPISYALYRRIGAVVMHPGTVMSPNDAVFNGPPDEWRTFGAVVMNEIERVRLKRDWVAASFLYFQRIDRLPPTIEPTSDTVYLVTLFYVFEKERSDKLISSPCPFAVAINGERKLRMLRFHHSATQRLPRHNGHITHMEWSYPSWLRLLRKTNRIRTEEDKRNDMLTLFRMAYAWCDLAQGDVRVAVHQGEETAVFSVDTLRIPYFFRDRERTLESGRRRIFHIVRTHQRGTKGSFVRSHFRGERDFMWHGRRVHITMPGKHHPDLKEFHGGAHMDQIGRAPPGWLNVRQLAVKLSQALDH